MTLHFRSIVFQLSILGGASTKVESPSFKPICHGVHDILRPENRLNNVHFRMRLSLSKVQWAVRQSGRYLPATPIPSAQVRQSFVPPMRDEEHEIQRKATKPSLTSKQLLTIALKILKTIEKPLVPMVGPPKNIQWWWSNFVKTIEKPLTAMVASKKTLTIPSSWKIDHRCGVEDHHLRLWINNRLRVPIFMLMTNTYKII